jgi:hypothetical protein
MDKRLSLDTPSQARVIPHSSPDVQYAFDHDTVAPAPLFAGKVMPQRLSQTFSTLAASASEPIGLGINERPISEYDSAPEINTAVRVSRVPLGERSTQKIVSKPPPVTREPWRGASGYSEQMTPIEATPAALSTVNSNSPSKSYFPRPPISLTSGSPDATDRTVETMANIAPASIPQNSTLGVPELRTWRSASTGQQLPLIQVDTPPVIAAKKAHNSPKSITRYNWGSKAVDRPPGTPESTISSGTWPSSRLSETHSNPTMRESALAQSAMLRTAAKAPTLAPIPQVPQASILDRKRPVPRPRDHIVEETAAATRAKSEALSQEITPPVSEAGEMPMDVTTDGLLDTPRAGTPHSFAPTMDDRSGSPASIHIPKLRAREPPRDRAAVLQTELDNLTSRRRTLERLIRNITEYAPVNPLIRDLATRREEGERVRAVERELAETRRREHDVGLKLVKAWQRREHEGPAQFWVRRVTK